MPYSLPLPATFQKARWKVKIRDKETREPPHVTVIRGTSAWRINLRNGEFMDHRPSPSEVPNKLLIIIKSEKNWLLLCEMWDQMYPNNPVFDD